jgi:DNA-binding MarR family transcriptional regulator
MPRPDDGDHVDHMVEQWASERPDLALGAMATFGRFGRVAALMTRAVGALFEERGLTTGEFDVLATLRRSGEPFEMKPSALARSLMLSPAGMTNRLDRLEAAGHVARRGHRDDRRISFVVLTPSGRELIDHLVTDHVANEERLLEPLSASERATLDRLLRKLQSQFD